MGERKEIRVTTFIDEYTQCELHATFENREPIIQTVNIVGDCVVTMDDLDDEGKEFFERDSAIDGKKAKNHDRCSGNQAVSLAKFLKLRKDRELPGYPKDWG
ncbi:MAG: hypothetical protein KF767_11685 [Bdellovibrionaceae bacterium]|nr:hypothetical protein [Pseudobdellovibrionaceae bacterium]